MCGVNIISNATDSEIFCQDLQASKPELKSFLELLHKVHKTVLDKYGKPDDVMPGIKNKREPLPPTPLVGMYNKAGGKVRLTFKLENDQLWIGTKGQFVHISFAADVIHYPVPDLSLAFL